MVAWLILRPNSARRLRFAGFARQFTIRERSVVVPQSKPFRPSRILTAFERDSSDSTAIGSSQESGTLDQSTALSSLKDLIADGDHRLDPMLGAIADAARQLTGACGAALAMWKEGAMVCRARSGDTAPALGARLSADTGISGECLRTGKLQHCSDTENNPLVDVDVCRALGLRSIVVLPIQGWRGINGILEVFSTQPGSFSEEHIALLQQLSVLAERARASQPHGASAAAPKPSSAIGKPQPSGLLPASDRVGDLALAFVDHRSRPFVLGGIALLAISLIAFVIWLGWRGPDDTNGRAHAAAPIDTATLRARTAEVVTAHAPDNDPVWKANPGGESLFISMGKPSAGAPVQFASKVDVVSKTKPSTQSTLLGDVAEKVAANVTILHPARDAQLDEMASSEPPLIPSESANQADINGVLSAKASLPNLSAPVSRGVSGGQLVHRVPPVYPAQARLLRLEGAVVLAATVAEDGTIRDVKVVEGSPVLAQSAVDAVKHWRYKPYELDGKPVSNAIRIKVDFKFPSGTASR